MSPERSKEQEHPKGVDSQTTIRAPAIGAYESASMVEDAGVYLVAIEGPNTGRWVPLGADPVTVGHDPHLDLSLSRPIRGRRLSADRYVPVTWRAYASGNIGRDIVEMEVTGLDNGLTKIVFSGRLDTPGVDRVETRFVAAVVPGSKSAIVDISGVEFVASMGIRMFITVARSLALRKAKLSLYGAQSMVNEVFEHVHLTDFVPVVDTEMEAITAVSA